MRLLIKKIILFIPILFVTYVVIVYLIHILPINHNFKKNIRFLQGSYGHMYSRIGEINNLDSIDVLILGSSHAYRGFDVRILDNQNLKYFNLGSSNQSHIQTKQLIKTYVPRLNPRIIIYEVFPTTLMNDGVESSLDLISNGEINVDALFMVLEVGDIRVVNTLIVREVRELFGINSGFIEVPVKGDDIYISGGFVEKEMSYYKPQILEPKVWEIKKKQLEALKWNIEYLKKHEIEVVLVFAPITKSLYNVVKDKPVYDSIFAKFGVTYVNENEKGLDLYDSLHFYDRHHLNQKGVEIFNEHFSHELENILN